MKKTFIPFLSFLSLSLLVCTTSSVHAGYQESLQTLPDGDQQIAQNFMSDMQNKIGYTNRYGYSQVSVTDVQATLTDLQAIKTKNPKAKKLIKTIIEGIKENYQHELTMSAKITSTNEQEDVAYKAIQNVSDKPFKLSKAKFIEIFKDKTKYLFESTYSTGDAKMIQTVMHKNLMSGSGSLTKPEIQTLITYIDAQYAKQQTKNSDPLLELTKKVEDLNIYDERRKLENYTAVTGTMTVNNISYSIHSAIVPYSSVVLDLSSQYVSRGINGGFGFSSLSDASKKEVLANGSIVQTMITMKNQGKPTSTYFSLSIKDSQGRMHTSSVSATIESNETVVLPVYFMIDAGASVVSTKLSLSDSYEATTYLVE